MSSTKHSFFENFLWLISVRYDIIYLKVIEFRCKTVKIKLKELREKENLSLNKLKGILKEKYNFSVSDSQLMYYENEIRKPRDEQIWSYLADYFGVSVGYLLGHEENTSEQLNNLIEDLEKKLTEYRKQYDAMKEILSERLQYLDQVLHEDEIHRGKAITTLHTIKSLVDSSDEMFELILSIKENHFKSEKLRLIIQSINQTNELIEKKRQKQ